MIITIGGNLGAGKTTLANNLANALHYEQLYVGGIFREMAAEKNLSIEQFYAQLKDDPALEQAVDKRQMKLMSEKENLVVQGRVAWYFAKQSPFRTFNILLTVDPATGAARVGERKENIGKTAGEVAIAVTEREKAERERYATLYGIENHLDPNHYDFVLDTTSLTEQQVFEKVLNAVYGKLSR
ncbi:MAG TPA: cytidylate kinase family protein [Candidatus Paceibacterota bacterium]|nr:cytidylate kinase family protein [Candidatus Paceibacterota bacterium]